MKEKKKRVMKRSPVWVYRDSIVGGGFYFKAVEEDINWSGVTSPKELTEAGFHDHISSQGSCMCEKDVLRAVPELKRMRPGSVRILTFFGDPTGERIRFKKGVNF